MSKTYPNRRLFAMRKLGMFAAASLLLVSAVSFAKEAKPKTYTLVLEGAIRGGCAGQLAKAIQSVEGAKVIVAPKMGTGEEGVTTAVVELNGKATLSKVAAAVEEAKTPHTSKVAPAVAGAVSLKLKQGTTHEQLY